ncbi:MAG: 7-cyano-7-deazaguanine synthase QueC [Myxococcales bacterium]|nr:7-cyano-7-deazaguanine synthase QueC [Myxococcales bacterium]
MVGLFLNGPAYSGIRARGIPIALDNRSARGDAGIVTEVNGKPKAVVLLSGGVDSATVAAMAKSTGFAVYALSCDYGQRHRLELEASKKVAASIGVLEHVTVQVGLNGFGGSALTEKSIAVPAYRGKSDEIPITYVPARNTVFLSIALSWAETLGAFDIFFGANAIDYSGYPDCRPAFVEAFERLANLATADGVEGRGQYRVHAPLISMTKPQIIQKAVDLGVDLAITHSCYNPSGDKSCGLCDSCVLRRQGFEGAGLKDPTCYT